MISYLKKMIAKARAKRAMKKAQKEAVFNQTIGMFEASKNCKHKTRIKKHISPSEVEVECMDCGLIKVLPKVEK